MKKLISAVIAAAVAFASLSCGMIPADAATIKGDVNGDNKITLRDATLAQRINVGKLTPSNYQRDSADFDSSGSVELSDALLIQKFVCLDKVTLDTYSPSRSQRIAFLNAMNADREASGLSSIDYNDAMLEAGNIRAKEYKQNNSSIRPDGRAFTTVFADCNLSGSEKNAIEKTGHDVIDGARLYNIYKNANSELYRFMMSSDCKLVCVGSIPDSETTATWVIDVA